MKFISEIGLNHNGNFSLCYELIKKSKISGADIAKFQLGWRGKKDEINYLNKERVQQLIKWGEYFEIDIMFSVFNKEALNLLKSLNQNSYKIASRTLIDDINLAKEIVDQKKTTYISLGMWEEKNFPFKKDKFIKYLWCKSTYPNTIEDLKKFPKIFDNSSYDGFSDHTIGIETSLLAISRGAQVIEKHFTLNKSDTTIRDHALSATPEEFKNLVELGKDINKRILNGI
tara:strand:+ start:1272 stop:1958 length:687 start_codon:yes stop_codon:yes gene_type:complete